jgi:uncharacterized membrane protein
MAILMRASRDESGWMARRVFVWSLLLGTLYALVTPPFAASDETEHLARAYALSAGELRVASDARGAYLRVPAAFAEQAERYGQVIAGVHERVNLRELFADLASRAGLVDTHRLAVALPVRGPLAYAPQLPVLLVSRALALPPLWSLYLARLAGVLSFALLASWALGREPVLAWLWFALALMPALLGQAAAATPAGLTLGLAFAFSLLLLRGALSGAERLCVRERWTLIALLVALVACAPACLTFALALPALRGREEETFAQRARYPLAAFGLALGVLALSAWLSEGVAGLTLSAQSGAQLASVARHPLAALSAWLRDLFQHSTEYASQLLIVREGLSKQMRFSAGLMATIYAQLLLWLAIGALYAQQSRQRVQPLARWLAASVVAYCGAVFLAAYLSADTPGSARLASVYGRAFMPAAPAASVVLASLGHPIARRWLLREDGKRVRIAVLAVNLLCLVVLFGRYYAAPVWPYLIWRD